MFSWFYIKFSPSVRHLHFQIEWVDDGHLRAFRWNHCRSGERERWKCYRSERGTRWRPTAATCLFVIHSKSTFVYGHVNCFVWRRREPAGNRCESAEWMAFVRFENGALPFTLFWNLIADVNKVGWCWNFYGRWTTIWTFIPQILKV